MLAIVEVLLVMFGYISSNSLVGIMIGTGTWSSFFQMSNLMAAGNLIAATGVAFGLIMNRHWLIFGGLAFTLSSLVLGINGIIAYFPVPLGAIIYGIISFIFVWAALEWWRMRDN